MGGSDPQDFHPQDDPQAVQGGHGLGDQRGSRCASHAGVKARHKKDIQHYIQDRGYHHGIERRTAVSQGPQQGGQQIVGHDNGNPRKQNPQIERCHGKDV